LTPHGVNATLTHVLIGLQTWDGGVARKVEKKSKKKDKKAKKNKKK
jgi:hypothetical protein